MFNKVHKQLRERKKARPQVRAAGIMRMVKPCGTRQVDAEVLVLLGRGHTKMINRCLTLTKRASSQTLTSNPTFPMLSMLRMPMRRWSRLLLRSLMLHDELERGLFGPVPPPARSLAELGVVVSVQGLGFRVYE